LSQPSHQTSTSTETKTSSIQNDPSNNVDRNHASRTPERSAWLLRWRFNSSTTFSAIAKHEVNPGDSIPNKNKIRANQEALLCRAICDVRTKLRAVTRWRGEMSAMTAK
jgi:hypothetical protein